MHFSYGLNRRFLFSPYYLDNYKENDLSNVPTSYKVLSEKNPTLKNRSEISDRKVVYRQQKKSQIIVNPIHSPLCSESKSVCNNTFFKDRKKF